MKDWKKDPVLLAISVGLIVPYIAFIWVVFLAFFHINPAAEITNLSLDKYIYYPGDTMIMESMSCRYTNVPVTITTSYFPINGRGVIYPERSVSLSGAREIGCAHIRIRVVIPEDIEPGKYTRFTKAEYTVNFIATRIATWETPEFIILERSE